jgi:hypothetical protein
MWAFWLGTNSFWVNEMVYGMGYLPDRRSSVLVVKPLVFQEVGYWS